MVFYNGCHYNSGFAHSFKTEGLFHNTLFKAFRGDVRGNTCLSSVTWTHKVKSLITAVSSGWEACSGWLSTFHMLFWQPDIKVEVKTCLTELKGVMTSLRMPTFERLTYNTYKSKFDASSYFIQHYNLHAFIPGLNLKALVNKDSLRQIPV